MGRITLALIGVMALLAPQGRGARWAPKAVRRAVAQLPQIIRDRIEIGSHPGRGGGRGLE